MEPLRQDALNHPFDCGKPDLNDFFVNDALNYEKSLMAKTYTLSPEGAGVSHGFPPVAFISFCNDAIVRELFVGKLKGSKNQWHKIIKQIPRSKRFNSLPAVKIARLGVQKSKSKRGVGTLLLNMTKLLFLKENRTGCRFLTVDAYITKEAIHLYKKNHFQFLTSQEEHRCTELLAPADRDETSEIEIVSMFYDLARSIL